MIWDRLARLEKCLPIPPPAQSYEPSAAGQIFDSSSVQTAAVTFNDCHSCGDECLLVPVEEEDLGGGSAAAAVVEEEPFILPLGIDMGLDVNTWSAFVG